MVTETENNLKEERVENGGTSVPEWLNEDFFKDILEKEFGDYQITSFTVAPAAGKGENYASLMNRVSIGLKLDDGTTTTGSYITKSMLESELTNKFLGDMGIFQKEIEMYKNIVPQMEKLYSDSGLDFHVGAKCVKTQTEPPLIVLEDLKVRGYENINRHEGMDLPHVHATLEKMAYFHAATARIHELFGPFGDQFKNGIFAPEMIAFMEAMLASIWPILEDCVRTWGDCDQYIGRIKSITHRFGDLITSAEKLDPDGFNVLNHGDMWSNNIMFKHRKDGTIEDTKFVDMQMGKWGSPALDLQYFIVSSCSYDIKIEKFDYFIKYYHEHLTKSLGILNYSGKVPRLIDLHIDLLQRGYFGLNVAFGTLSAVLLDPADNAEMELFLTESHDANEFKRQLYLTPRYVKTMKALLPFFENRGILDL